YPVEQFFLGADIAVLPLHSTPGLQPSPIRPVAQVHARGTGRSPRADLLSLGHLQGQRTAPEVSAFRQSRIELLRAHRRSDLEPGDRTARGVELLRRGDPALQLVRPGI